MIRLRASVLWSALAAVTLTPLALAASSPLLAWREPVYIAAGFAGIAAMALLLLQPLLAGTLLPGLPRRTGRRLHRWTGAAILLAILVHVAGLWITSPPDMIDALTFTAPTAFSVFGVLAMWALLATALLALFRRRLRWRSFTRAHLALAFVIVTGTILHAVQIEGTMEPVSKYALAAALAGAFATLLLRRR